MEYLFSEQIFYRAPLGSFFCVHNFKVVAAEVEFV